MLLGMVARRGWTVSGRVQGVGFRYFVQARAGELGLRGWVRNLAGGPVEVAAAGPAAALDRLEAALSMGPPHARVENVTPFEPPASLEEAQDFAIKY